MPRRLQSRHPPSSIVVLLLLLLLPILPQVMLAATRSSCSCYRPVSAALALVPTSVIPTTTRPPPRRSAAVMSTKGAAFKTLAAPTEYGEVIKKSRFLTRAVPATSFAEAQDFLKRVSDLKATHNCWGWRGQGEERSSDDGEPGGTAGRPILSAIESEDLVDVMVVVTRYFGGIKLGAGGLVRAYGGVARTCLRNAETVTHIPKVLMRLTAPLAMSGALFKTISCAEKMGEEYTAEEVMVDVKVDASQVEGLRQQLQDATKGEGRLEERKGGDGTK